MKNRLNHFCLVFLLVVLWLGASVWPAFAQEGEVQLARVEVDLWPEYDDPRMLVIYQITLSPQISLPVELRLHIPRSAGAPNAVAARQPDDLLVNIPYTQEDAGIWMTIVFQATTPEIQLEFYDPLTYGEDFQRSYVYLWPGDYAVNSLSIQVQQPFGAEEMKLIPALDQSSQGLDGLTYFSSELGGIAKGQTFKLEISYRKESDELSANSLPVEPAAPLDESASGRKTMLTILPWILGTLGVFLIFGGGFWYWYSGRQIVSLRPRREEAKHFKEKPPAEGPASGESIYCHQCGKRAERGDRYCRACGTMLRV